MSNDDTARFFLYLCAALAGLHAVFGAVPRIDVWLSNLFWVPKAGFVLNGNPALTAMREGLLRLMQGMAALALLGWLSSGRFRGLAMVPRVVWGRIVLLYALGPILLVNVVLKDHWGRARPAQIIEFGGVKHFTPAFQIADECGRNCSFVSGEASGAAAFAVSLFWIAEVAPERYRSPLRSLAIGVCVLGAGLRLAMGRHFASDVIFGVLFTLMIACLVKLVVGPAKRSRIAGPGADTATQDGLKRDTQGLGTVF